MSQQEQMHEAEVHYIEDPEIAAAIGEAADHPLTEWFTVNP